MTIAWSFAGGWIIGAITDQAGREIVKGRTWKDAGAKAAEIFMEKQHG